MSRAAGGALGLCLLLLASAVPLGVGHGPPVGVGRPIFTEVTGAAGLGGYLHAGYLGEDGGHALFTEIMGPGACWLDADRDGHLDLYLVNGVYQTEPAKNELQQPRSALWHGDGAGFVEQDAGARLVGVHMGCAAADYDNDGWPDLYVTGWGGSVLLRNLGDGTFANATASAGVGDATCGSAACWASSATWLDYDRDGCLDLFVDHFGEFDPASPPANNGPDAVVPQQNRLYRNSCDGTFSDVTAQAGLTQARHSWSSAAADVDGDGWPDLYVSNDGDGNDLLRNQGDGTFLRVDNAADNAQRHGMGTAIGDLDLDGRPDLVSTNFVNEANAVLLGGATDYADIGGQAPFDDALPWSGWATRIADLDANGWPDLMVVNGLTESIPGLDTAEPVLVYENLGSGQYRIARDDLGPGLAGSFVGRGAAWADYDDDGALDVVLMEAGEHGAHLLRASRMGGNFLSIDLVGTQPGTTRDAVGARVTVRAAGLPDQMQEKQLGEGFLSSSDPRLRFGLGDAESAEAQVRWPDGSTETFTLRANTFTRITQGSGAVTLRTLPLVSLSGPVTGARLADLGFAAEADASASLADVAWAFDDGGSAHGGAVQHAFDDVGWFTVHARATDSLGRAAGHSRVVQVTDHLQASVAPDKAAFLPTERATGNVTVRFSDGDPVRGAEVHLAVTYSTGLPALDAALQGLPRAARQLVVGDGAWHVDGVTDAQGRFHFILPFSAPSPTGLLPLDTNHVGAYHITATGGARGSAFDAADAAYVVGVPVP